MLQQENFDIFISYSREDNKNGDIQDFIELLHTTFDELYHTPLHIFFDKHDIEHGEDWNRKLHTSLKNSHLMIAFVSENYIKSEWCRKEWRLWCEVERNRGWLSNMLLPVYCSPINNVNERTQKFKLQRDIFNKTNILHNDTVGFKQNTDENSCLTDLFSRQYCDICQWDTQNKLQKKEQIKAFVKTLHKKIKQAQHSVLNTDHFMRVNPNFYGRIDELKSIRKCLSEAKSGLVPIIHGVGGEGKTELAIAYGHAFSYDYPGGRFFVNCEGLKSLKDCFLKLAQDLGLQLIDTTNENIKLQQVLLWLQNRPHGRSLVVLDYIDNIDVLLEKDLASFIPAKDSLHIIATTRLGCHSLGSTAVPISLRNMSLTDALDLLHSLRPFEQSEEESVWQIIQNLGSHALSLQLAGAFLRENDDVSYADFATELINEGMLNVLEQTTDVANTVKYNAEFESIERLILPSLEKFSHEEKSALQLISLLAPEEVVGPWIQEALELLYPKSMRKKGLKNPWAAIVRKFNGLCLWQEQEQKNTYHVHRLVHEVIGKQLEHNLHSPHLLLHNIAVEKADAHSNGDPSWPLAFFLKLLPTLSLWFHKRENKEDFLCLPEVLMSKILRGTGYEVLCIEVATSILQYLSTLPENLQTKIFTATIFACRGQSFLAQGASDKALTDYTNALNLLKDIPDDASVSILQKCVEILDYAGEAESKQGNIQKALQLHNQALGILDSLLKRPHVDTLQLEAEKCYTLDHMAHNYKKLLYEESMQKALDYFMMSLQKRESICLKAPDNLRFLRDYANSCEALGDLYFSQKNNESEKYYSKSLEIRQRLYKQDKNNTLYQRDLSIAYNKSGENLLSNNRVEEGTLFFEKSLILRKTMFEKKSDNYQMAYDYSFSLLKVGEVCLAKNTREPQKTAIDTAINHYEEAKKIRQVLSAKLPGKIEWYRGLALACYKCAIAYTEREDTTHAKNNLEQAHNIIINILHILPEHSPQREELESNINAIQAQLKKI